MRPNDRADHRRIGDDEEAGGDIGGIAGAQQRPKRHRADAAGEGVAGRRNRRQAEPAAAHHAGEHRRDQELPRADRRVDDQKRQHAPCQAEARGGADGALDAARRTGRRQARLGMADAKQLREAQAAHQQAPEEEFLLPRAIAKGDGDHADVEGVGGHHHRHHLPDRAELLGPQRAGVRLGNVRRLEKPPQARQRRSVDVVEHEARSKTQTVEGRIEVLGRIGRNSLNNDAT